MSSSKRDRSTFTDTLRKDLSTSSSTVGPVFTPTSSTSPGTPHVPATTTSDLEDDDHISVHDMDPPQGEKPSDEEIKQGTEEEEEIKQEDTKAQDEVKVSTQDPKKQCKAGKHKGKADTKANKKKTNKKKKKKKKCSSSDDSSSSESDDDDTSDSSDSSNESSSDDDDKKARRKRKAQKKKRKLKSKSKSKSKRARDSESSSSSSDSDESIHSTSDISSEEDTHHRRRNKRDRRSKRRDEESEGEVYSEDDDEEEEADAEEAARLRAAIAKLSLRSQNRRTLERAREIASRSAGKGGHRKKKKKLGKRASTLEFKRVDQLWDNSIHNYKLTESAKEELDEFNQYVFTVRRKFDWENKYKNTVVDIKSKLLREALQEIMKDVKGVSFVEDVPSVDPNMLFLYLEELRTHAKTTLKARVKAEKKRKLKKRMKSMAAHCKVLIKYLDEDYAETKKTLYPMLEEGTITFDLLWALFKPNSIAFTTTYGSVDDPRCYKVDYASREQSFMRGEWYSIEGRYLEYDGKSFGLGEFDSDVDAFKGARKITTLSTYPLQYHKDAEGIKAKLIDRGKHFISLQGMNYRFHKGLAFMKKKRAVAKVNINGRVMIDPAIFRRVNPNYQISMVKANDPDEEESDEDDCSGCCNSGSDRDGPSDYIDKADRDTTLKTKWKVILDKDQNYQVVKVDLDDQGREIHVENLEKFPNTDSEDSSQQLTKREFTDEELLIASPVVLGFAFSEKLWLEFSLAGVREIEWNAGAFESLVLPPNQKSIVKALVESHKFHAAKTIDDVVQGKGKGLVAVLHGPPGTGKTLTAEGIAELLKCPLYMVSAGELGTDSRVLEHELQKILDIAHSWGAVLLLDEADVFLEKRELHDIQRNALVSIFLRLLEYFQGILFLTTNRVQTFDDAFQSRIHIALRYGELTTKAKKAVWKMFLEKVNAMEGVRSVSWTEEDYTVLAKQALNGRQIKNAVRTAQALAVNEGTNLGMEHLKRVLQVAESFEQDLKGGTGYTDAMRSYT